MPLYEYECDACRHRFEVIQKFSDPLVETCPACGGAVHKLLSSPAIQFKGSGWYITDYARAGKSDKSETSDKGAATAASDGAGSTAAKTEGSSDSKSEAKTPKTETKTESKSESKPATPSKPS
jgi:putative FmdB family regulatory protein